MHMCNATILCSCTRTRACAYVNARVWVNVQCNYSVCVHAYVCVTIVIYAVIGILRIFNYFLGNLKYRLDVQFNYYVCTRTRTYACVTIVVHTDMYAVIGILRNTCTMQL